MLSRASVSVQPTTLNWEAVAWPEWPAAARFWTNVLYVPILDELALRLVEDRNRRRKESPTLQPAGDEAPVVEHEVCVIIAAAWAI